ncbi:SOS response-associated peptidase [Sediminibacillus halophilus]|uniref:Abasic site processing protein n=1 Tax=Sediminibacillus halophilus TaxID=482461 RepID=A0A1G9VD16_9BACI|nr:SOS response-associated peptidase [Sediminibacillus halophilus]SDM69970.1 Putative SOS response-associated peptidase YedK [Sediminibacillus halophilus]
MCGRFTLQAGELEILKEYDLDQRLEGYQNRFNIAPGQPILSIIHDGKERRAGFLRWGLVPSWAKDPKIGYKMINARSESAHAKPSFKNLLARKRCLIVADSFYEWKQADGQKQPKRISSSRRSLFAFAGLWDKWEREDEETLFTCTILTRKADRFMEDIHDRMPVILPKEAEDDWIAPVKRSPEEVSSFIEELPSEPLQAYDVSTFVNSPKNEGETCIKPLA